MTETTITTAPAVVRAQPSMLAKARENFNSYNNKRGKGQKVTDAEFGQAILKQVAQCPTATAWEVLCVLYHVQFLAFGRVRFNKIWATLYGKADAASTPFDKVPAVQLALLGLNSKGQAIATS